jgi:hypothetical protein
VLQLEPEFVERAYPTALIPADVGPEQTDQLAVRWATQQQMVHGGEILLYRPSRDAFFKQPVMREFVSENVVIDSTWRTLWRTTWREGPVIAAWPDRAHLADIARHPGTRALCVLGWSEADTTDWIRVAKPQVLNPSAEPPSELADPVVRAAFQYLTAFVTQSSALLSDDDHDAAVATLRILRRHGHAVDATDIYRWATTNGWAEGTALRLRELAKDISDGKDPRVRQNPLARDIYDVVWVPESRRVPQQGHWER